MILARLTRAVREQNWFAVTIEFVIVIAGVVIGFRVSELAAAARERAEELRALERLQVESQANVAFWSENVADAIERDAQRLILLEALEAGEIQDGDEDAVQVAIERLYHYPALSPPRTAFDELLSSGGLSRISDAAAREAVSEYADTYAFINGQLDQFRISISDGAAAQQGRVFSVFDPTDPTLRRLDYDFADLAADRAFVSATVDGVRNQRVFLFFRLGALNRALDMCEALSAAQGEQCETAEEGRIVYEAARAHFRDNQEGAE